MKKYFLGKNKNLNFAPPGIGRHNNWMRGSIFLVFLFLFACNKDQMATFPDNNASVYVTSAVLEKARQGLRDPLAIKFFDFGYAVGANPNVKPLPSDRSDEAELLNGVAYELLRLNQSYNIVPAMLSRVGFPYWSRSEIFEDGNTGRPVVLLPFAHLDSDSVEAVLLATPLSDSVGWYTTLYTRKQIDSLTATTVLDTDGLGFKVASFVFLDHKLFGTTAQPLVDWLTTMLAGANVSPAAHDRCGIISWCVDIFGAVFPATDKQVLDRTLLCFTFNTPCTGASAGSGASNCALNENFVWVCDYMLGNWEANGGGGGGGSANMDPGSTPAGDMGTNILNLYNNGMISEEVMNQLLTLHFAIGLTQNEIILFLAKPQLMETLVEFLSANAGSAHPLDPFSIKYVLAFAIQYDLTPAQFEALLGNRALFQQVKNYTLQNPSNQTENTEVVQLHIDLMLDVSDQEYAQRNQAENYPAIGSIEWANTLDVTEEGIVDDFMTLKAAEKALTLQYIPASLKIRKNRQIARSKQKGFWGSNPNVTWLGKGDAFLHTYFQAINTQSVGPYITKLFADAHETEHPPILHLETEMDLFNNDVGINIGVHNPNVNIHGMADIVHVAVLGGGCKYLSPVDHIASPEYDPVNNPNCTNCLNGILPTTVMKWTDQ
jgi:hypothetical protein